MYALTIKQPWLYAIMHLGKNIENRTWKPPGIAINQRIALHAAMVDDPDGCQAIYNISGHCIRPDHIERGCILATATLAGYVRSSSDRWFAGPYGWILNNIHRLPEPVFCKGSQSLWQVPDDITIRAGLNVWQ